MDMSKAFAFALGYGLLLLTFPPMSLADTKLVRVDGDNGVVVDHYKSRDYEKVVEIAGSACKKEGVGEPSIKRTKIGCYADCNTEYDTYEFVCTLRTSQNLDKVGEKCVALGFKRGTVDFGNCVLKLMDIETRQARSISETQRDEEAREQAAIAKRKLEQAVAERRSRDQADADVRARELMEAEARARDQVAEDKARARSYEDYMRTQSAIDSFIRNTSVQRAPQQPIQAPSLPTTTNCRRVGQEIQCVTQ